MSKQQFLKYVQQSCESLTAFAEDQDWDDLPDHKVEAIMRFEHQFDSAFDEMCCLCSDPLDSEEE